MAANARVKAYAVDNLLGVQSLHLGIGVQLVEVGNAQCQIGVAEQLNCLCFSKAHEQRINIFFNRTLLQQTSEGVRSFHEALILQVSADDDAARIKVIVQRLALAQKLRAEDNVLAAGFLTDALGVANRNRGFDNHDGVRIVLHNQLDNCFYGTCVEEVLLAVIVRRCSDNNEVCVFISHLCIQRSNKVQLLLCQIFFNIIVLNRGKLFVNQFNLLRNNVNSLNLVVLRKQRSKRKTNVASTGNCNFHVYHAPFNVSRILFNFISTLLYT